ncbi:MAG TPA: SDR family oxidoreductase [Pseudorhodoferax sp.]|jgi:NAD(P)-dependent dehydrogenase (short-subunit alcohol dehydrogenase family)|nr:SDR family oxidoreductase [Pseudorhodoferax sp.]
MNARALAGRVAVVTGAGRGIGLAIAEDLAARGADLALFDLQPPDDVAARIAAAHGVRTLAVAADVSDEASVATGCAQVAQQLGCIAVLVNNAGIMQRESADHHSLPASDLQRMLAVHVGGASAMCAAVLPGMRAQGFGRIVNMSSVIGLVGLQRRTAYSTAKAAIAGLTRGLALENGRHGVTVNAVAPGYVLTEVLREKMRLGTLDHDLFAERSAVGRWARPEEIARVVGFLAEPASGFITAAVWPVDGGYAANGNPGEPLGPLQAMDAMDTP